MTDNHKKFLTHLDDSQSAVWLVAEWLNNRGYDVTINATKKAPSHDDWKNYADNGDLEIKQRIEVKHLSAEFTCMDDWPFGNKFIVCAKHAFDRAKPKPYAYIILNNKKTHMALVMGATSNSWFSEIRKDSRYNQVDQEFYFCPINEVKFTKI